MNSRYYIRGDKLYPRYNYKQPRRRNALRKNDVFKIIERRSFLWTLFIYTSILSVLAMGVYMLLSKNPDNEPYSLPAFKVEVVEVPDVQKTKKITEEIDENEIMKTSSKSVKEQSNSIQEMDLDLVIEHGTYVTDLVHREYNSSSLQPMQINGFPVLKMDLPSKFYDNLDFSSFQPLEPIQKITDTSSSAYRVCYGEGIYVDPNGLIRKEVNETQLSINGNDDYVVAMGSFYNESRAAGSRFLIETSNGAFTVTIGDAKADDDTDSMNMFTLHNGKAGIIEFIIDRESVHKEILSAGTPMNGPDPIISGNILGIYKIS